jgi:hypothetical protein
MSKRLSIWLFVLGCVALGSRTAAHDQFRFVGTVVKMDLSKNSMTFKTVENKKTETLKVVVTDRTPIERDGKKVTRADLKPGASVVIDALGDDYDAMDATNVKIVPAPGK